VASSRPRRRMAAAEYGSHRHGSSHRPVQVLVQLFT
jgi:hypothetical protein